MSDHEKTDVPTWLTRQSLPDLLRKHALADVHHMRLPPERTMVEMAAAEEIERLRNALQELREAVGQAGASLHRARRVGQDVLDVD